jgi:hypothetical protein
MRPGRTLWVALLFGLSACGSASAIEVVELSATRLPDDRVEVDVTFECDETLSASCSSPWCMRVEWYVDGGPPPPGHQCDADIGPPVQADEHCGTEELRDGDRRTVRIVAPEPVATRGWLRAYPTEGADYVGSCAGMEMPVPE